MRKKLYPKQGKVSKEHPAPSPWHTALLGCQGQMLWQHWGGSVTPQLRGLEKGNGKGRQERREKSKAGEEKKKEKIKKEREGERKKKKRKGGKMRNEKRPLLT